MKKTKWTRFMDMNSGGGRKEKGYEHIFIEAPEHEAKVIFYNRFGHSPDRVSCTCCGEDYSISEGTSLEDLSAYDRNCEYVYRRPDGTVCDRDEAWVPGKGITKGYKGGYEEIQDQSQMDIRAKCNTEETNDWGLYVPLEKYLKLKTVLVIYAKDIKAKERKGSVPEQGYVWK